MGYTQSRLVSSELVGKTLGEAEEMVQWTNIHYDTTSDIVVTSLRVVRRDGVYCNDKGFHNTSLVRGRLNVYIDNGIISSVSFIG